MTPADVDVEAVREELSAVKAEAFDILGKYSVKTLDELEALAKKIDDVKLKVDNANNRLAMVLGTTTFEELEAKVKTIDTSVRPKNEIEREIIFGYIHEKGWSLKCGLTDEQREEFRAYIEEQLRHAYLSRTSNANMPTTRWIFTRPRRHR